MWGPHGNHSATAYPTSSAHLPLHHPFFYTCLFFFHLFTYPSSSTFLILTFSSFFPLPFSLPSPHHPIPLPSLNLKQFFFFLSLSSIYRTPFLFPHSSFRSLHLFLLSPFVAVTPHTCTVSSLPLPLYSFPSDLSPSFLAFLLQPFK